jgi:hypothetical protein
VPSSKAKDASATIWGDGDNKLSFTFKDTGLSDSDGITNNNTITVDGLKEGETWQYSTDGGATFH